jgi:hypothetical protein
MQAAGWYYLSKPNGARAVTFYGPFADERDAAHAAYFNRPVADRDADPRMATRRGVCRYDEGELDGVLAEPQPYGWSRAKVAARAPLHRTWREFGVEFREGLFGRDYLLGGGRRGAA